MTIEDRKNLSKTETVQQQAEQVAAKLIATAPVQTSLPAEEKGGVRRRLFKRFQGKEEYRDPSQWFEQQLILFESADWSVSKMIFIVLALKKYLGQREQLHRLWVLTVVLITIGRKLQLQHDTLTPNQCNIIAESLPKLFIFTNGFEKLPWLLVKSLLLSPQLAARLSRVLQKVEFQPPPTSMSDEKQNKPEFAQTAMTAVSSINFINWLSVYTNNVSPVLYEPLLYAESESKNNNLVVELCNELQSLVGWNETKIEEIKQKNQRKYRSSSTPFERYEIYCYFVLWITAVEMSLVLLDSIMRRNWNSETQTAGSNLLKAVEFACRQFLHFVDGDSTTMWIRLQENKTMVFSQDVIGSNRVSSTDDFASYIGEAIYQLPLTAAIRQDPSLLVQYGELNSMAQQLTTTIERRKRRNHLEGEKERIERNKSYIPHVYDKNGKQVPRWVWLAAKKYFGLGSLWDESDFAAFKYFQELTLEEVMLTLRYHSGLSDEQIKALYLTPIEYRG